MMHLAIAVNNRDRKLIPALISLFTWSKAFHTELIFSDGVTFQATSPGVKYYKDVVYDRYQWVLLPLLNITPEIEDKIRKRADAIESRHPKYDYLGAIFGGFHSTIEESDKWYCSELCRCLLRELFPSINDDKWITPDRLWRGVAHDLTTTYSQHLSPSVLRYSIHH